MHLAGLPSLKRFCQNGSLKEIDGRREGEPGNESTQTLKQKSEEEVKKKSEEDSRIS